MQLINSALLQWGRGFKTAERGWFGGDDEDEEASMGPRF